MSFPKRINEFLANNKVFTQTYKTPPGITTIGAMQKTSGEGIMILTCLDPRCVPEQYFGPNLMAGVIRNAGGRVSKDVISSIVTIRALAGIKTVMVVHHTDCGMTHLTDEQIAKEALERTPDAAEEIGGLEYRCFTAEDFEETIKKDVVSLRNAKVLGGMNIYGFAMDINTGVVRPLDV